MLSNLNKINDRLKMSLKFFHLDSRIKSSKQSVRLKIVIEEDKTL